MEDMKSKAPPIDTLICGNCLDVLPSLPKDTVDLVLTDPPYCSGGTNSERRDSLSQKYFSKPCIYKEFDGDYMDQRSLTNFLRQAFYYARKCAQPGAIIASFTDWRNLPALTDAIQQAGWTWRGIVVWDKKNSRPLRGRFSHRCEYIVWGSNGHIGWRGSIAGLPGFYSLSSIPSKNRVHPTEKPLELLGEIMKIVPPGSTVLDPFMGSGSTCIACSNMGNHFIGIESNSYYYEIARSKIAEHQSVFLELPNKAQEKGI